MSGTIEYTQRVVIGDYRIFTDAGNRWVVDNYLFNSERLKQSDNIEHPTAEASVKAAVTALQVDLRAELDEVEAWLVASDAEGE